MIASIIPILAGFFGIWRIIVQSILINTWNLLDEDRLMTPLSVVPLVTLVGLWLYAHGFPQFSTCRVSVPYPRQWGTPSADGSGDAFVMIAAALVALLESTGAFIAATRFARATPPPPSIIGRGAGWLGVGLLLDGFFSTASGSTVSVKIWGCSSIYMLPIFGAVYYILFACMASAGIGLLQFCNLNRLRTKFVVAYSIFMGLSITQYFYGYIVTFGHGSVHTQAHWFNTIVEIIFTSPATVAVLIAVLLDCTIRPSRTDSGIFDNGRHWWERFRDFEKHPMSREFYYLPSGLTKYFPSV